MRTLDKMGWVGLVAVLLIVTALLTIVVLPGMARAREASNRALCQSTLKQWALIFKLYTREWNDRYPRMQGPPQWLVDGVPTAQLGRDCNADDGFHLTPNPTSIFPEYANDFDVLRCPSSGQSDLKVIPQGCKYAGIPTRGDVSYQYLGFAFTSDDESQGGCSYIQVSNDELSRLLHALFVRIQKSQKDAGPGATAELLERDIELTDEDGAKAFNKLHRLRNGMERFFISDCNGTPPEFSTIPVMWDRVLTGGSTATVGLQLSHSPGGSNLLYDDGHVIFRPYTADKFPVTPVFAEVLRDSGLLR